MNSDTSESSYGAPANQLLLLGKPRNNERPEDKWRDYTALGLSRENIPDLIRMATDDRVE